MYQTSSGRQGSTASTPTYGQTPESVANGTPAPTHSSQGNNRMNQTRSKQSIPIPHKEIMIDQLAVSPAPSVEGSDNILFLPSIASGLKSPSGESVGSSKSPNKPGLTGLPPRATLRKQKQIPGRFFPAPSLSDDQKLFLKTSKIRPHNRCYTANGYVNVNLGPVPHKRQNTAGPNKVMKGKSANSKKNSVSSSLQEEAEGVYTFNFRDEEHSSNYYDPTSELRSDYYTVERVVPIYQTRKVNFPGDNQFQGMLEGTSKTLHEREETPVSFSKGENVR